MTGRTAKALFASLLLVVGGMTGQAAAAPRIVEVATLAPITAIRQTGEGAFVVAGKQTFRLDACDSAPVCLKPAARLADRVPPPEDALPDGRIAFATTGDIRRAWYAAPTRRYGHGALADKIEAGALVAEKSDGTRLRYVLPQIDVFEDIAPRIADLDGDGRNEIVTIRSSLEAGSAVAIYGIRDRALAFLDATPEIGKPHRWLNIAGIADYTGAGVSVIAWVQTPHIGGILKMAAFSDGKLDVFTNSYPGFSNHIFGTREQGLSATGDFTGDGVPDLAIPSADRQALKIAARTGISDIPVGGKIGKAVVAVGGRIVTATENGRLIVVVP